MALKTVKIVMFLVAFGFSGCVSESLNPYMFEYRTFTYEYDLNYDRQIFHELRCKAISGNVSESYDFIGGNECTEGFCSGEIKLDPFIKSYECKLFFEGGTEVRVGRMKFVKGEPSFEQTSRTSDKELLQFFKFKGAVNEN